MAVKSYEKGLKNDKKGLKTMAVKSYEDIKKQPYLKTHPYIKKQPPGGGGVF